MPKNSVLTQVSCLLITCPHGTATAVLFTGRTLLGLILMLKLLVLSKCFLSNPGITPCLGLFALLLIFF